MSEEINKKYPIITQKFTTVSEVADCVEKHDKVTPTLVVWGVLASLQPWQKI